MTEEITAVEPVQTPGQPASPPPDPTDGVNWEARYKGMVKKVEELTLGSQSKDTQLSEKVSEIERLSAELGLKDTEKTVAVGERDKQLTVLSEAKSASDTELARLRSLEMKVKIANKIGSPGMLAIVDSIPSVDDEEALEALMKNISDWGDQKVKVRETELLAGVTPDVTATPAQVDLPTTNEDWQAHVQKLPMKSVEREQAMTAWRDWGLSQNK
ncbi:MAG: hypothetical protein KAJ73_09970 [Zetaproteobacteria bacterium]|nr:hypothetical protein [Zetaproteobacteria bacterium]